MRVGVLALQGGFAEHIRHLKSLDIKTFEIRKKEDAQQPMDGLIIPGGESTTMGKLLKELNLYNLLREKIQNGLPAFGTCAGMILLAKQLAESDVVHLGLMDIVVKRNAYGRQLGSFHTEALLDGIGTIPMTFIRAPYIESAGPKVKILSTINGKALAAREKNMLVTAFHPELTDDNRVHRYFAEEIILPTSLRFKHL
ncbi:MAG: pyridoxal 5'-phosphate synthase glutaminase subunit PdxT [Candidatus Symbiothrix sp.]|jgi:5'-phosphate synthase pdxT subunit|nr:pyridoxal 5'-phosphate synthase glutaminase subunit PdxT [Candidatus Symbiothrix sp.]